LLELLFEFPLVALSCPPPLPKTVLRAYSADIKQFIGLPPAPARYAIMRDCVLELSRVGLLAPPVPIAKDPPREMSEVEALLAAAAAAAEGLSGRTLRKLPFLAHATYIAGSSDPCTCTEFSAALRQTVDDEHGARRALQSDGASVLEEPPAAEMKLD